MGMCKGIKKVLRQPGAPSLYTSTLPHLIPVIVHYMTLHFRLALQLHPKSNLRFSPVNSILSLQAHRTLLWGRPSAADGRRPWNECVRPKNGIGAMVRIP